ncbi:hypothetical protein AX774_g1737 [Zancudomyces culisetae]|uniref:Uncharacterized protein n=1 Tax=Zancudomyces culisetae TaxID=1213189 RepID=A0A1R1PUX7_ZANCU|nr:hypothetical protein AX774_g1737 [Zancudomyces culisetae]|eukprot:OMH84729.1 hypothetical protein AX774_g1737 [Zancudomyces culisetae]
MSINTEQTSEVEAEKNAQRFWPVSDIKSAKQIEQDTQRGLDEDIERKRSDIQRSVHISDLGATNGMESGINMVHANLEAGGSVDSDLINTSSTPFKVHEADNFGIEGFSDLEEEERGFEQGLERLLGKKQVRSNINNLIKPIPANEGLVEHDTKAREVVEKVNNLGDDIYITNKESGEADLDEKGEHKGLEIHPEHQSQGESFLAIGKPEDTTTLQKTYLDHEITVRETDEVLEIEEIGDANESVRQESEVIAQESEDDEDVSEEVGKLTAPVTWMKHDEKWVRFLGKGSEIGEQDKFAQNALFETSIEQLIVFLRTKLEIMDSHRITLEFPTLELFLNQNDAECTNVSLEKLYNYHCAVLLLRESHEEPESYENFPGANDFLFILRVEPFASHTLSILNELLDGESSEGSSESGSEGSSYDSAPESEEGIQDQHASIQAFKRRLSESSIPALFDGVDAAHELDDNDLVTFDDEHLDTHLVFDDTGSLVSTGLDQPPQSKKPKI